MHHPIGCGAESDAYQPMGVAYTNFTSNFPHALHVTTRPFIFVFFFVFIELFLYFMFCFIFKTDKRKLVTDSTYKTQDYRKVNGLEEKPAKLDQVV